VVSSTRRRRGKATSCQELGKSNSCRVPTPLKKECLFSPRHKKGCSSSSSFVQGGGKGKGKDGNAFFSLPPIVHRKRQTTPHSEARFSIGGRGKGDIDLSDALLGREESVLLRKEEILFGVRPNGSLP